MTGDWVLWLLPAVAALPPWDWTEDCNRWFITSKFQFAQFQDTVLYSIEVLYLFANIYIIFVAISLSWKLCSRKIWTLDDGSHPPVCVSSELKCRRRRIAVVSWCYELTFFSSSRRSAMSILSKKIVLLLVLVHVRHINTVSYLYVGGQCVKIWAPTSYKRWIKSAEQLVLA